MHPHFPQRPGPQAVCPNFRVFLFPQPGAVAVGNGHPGEPRCAVALWSLGTSHQLIAVTPWVGEWVCLFILRLLGGPPFLCFRIQSLVH